ncbi:MAG TPA: hypothetical protein DDZ68_13125, partial [Parvularcula sp.]|nr:hypothetical protein [Parvularcula sp.]
KIKVNANKPFMKILRALNGPRITEGRSGAGEFTGNLIRFYNFLQFLLQSAPPIVQSSKLVVFSGPATSC